MSNRALDLYEQCRPLESLESFIFRTAQRASLGGGTVLQLRNVENNQGGIEFCYDVDVRRKMELQEMGALSGFAVAAALALRALVTRRSGHVLGAIQATSVALAFGGREVPHLIQRVRKRKDPGSVVLAIRGSQLSFKVGAEEVLVDLAPVTGLTVRSFRFHWDPPRPALHFAHIEMQDGRLLTITETEDSVALRRLVHQIAKPVPVELSFQNVDLYREKEKVSWELGPRLVEPALN
jgi:hypothetical protein